MLARMVAAQRAPGSPAAFTEREYLALESVAETRHEFVGGQILGMAGAEPEHNQIVHNLHVALDLALRARRCRIAGADQRVRIEATGDYVYPDVVVTCAEARYVEPAPRSLTNPELVIEVLSPTTEAYDRGAKWAAYQTVSSLRDYVLVSTERRRIEHYRRTADGWGLRVVTDGEWVVGDDVRVLVEDVYRMVGGS
jgi:Uma2 family endonuclease